MAEPGEVRLDLDELTRNGATNAFLGSVDPNLARWLVDVLEAIRTGAIAVLPSAYRPRGLYFARLDGFQITLSVKGRKGKVLQISRIRT